MAEYDMQELTLPNEDGKCILYPRMKFYGQKELEYIADQVSYETTFSQGEIRGLVQSIADEGVRNMAQGYSVKIDGLGIFTPSLGLRQGKERESDEENGTHRNAASICMKDINFKVDKDLLYETGHRCNLEHASNRKFRRSSQMFATQERMERAKELKAWAAQPDTGIDYHGRGTHKLYILRPL